MEVYVGEKLDQQEGEDMDEDILEFDLDEEEAELALKAMAIAVYYSRKSFNPHVLFTDMAAA
jgi:hypothetical protein